MEKKLEQWDKKGKVFSNVFILTLVISLSVFLIFEFLHYVRAKQKLSAYVAECQEYVQNALDKTISLMDQACEDYYSDVFNENESIFKYHIEFLVTSDLSVDSLTYIPEQGTAFSYWRSGRNTGTEIILRSRAAQKIVDYRRGHDFMLYGSEAESIGTALLNYNYIYFRDKACEALANGQDYIFPLGFEDFALVRSMNNYENGGYMAAVLPRSTLLNYYLDTYSYTLSCPYQFNNYVLASSGDIMEQKGAYTFDVPGTTWYLDIRPKPGIISGKRLFVELLMAVLVSLLLANKAKDRMTIRKLENIIRSQ